ncbi:MAG: tRNA (adenosine(37)-N6)-threonylcarbamoyltransferase complex ATPase subunit type 1 TsaE [Armatimonadetes bacterium]|nr:tRNA (adenosine(37)-N6)-threonylcarbamoyltransferase complex ATPase subunit type 1 TsaE [Armatimonadota bacterium]
MDWKLKTKSGNETKKLAMDLAKMLSGGEVICLSGELGSGKTTFVQGLAEGLGITMPIISPTFTIVREYIGRLLLFHVDAYRLSNLSAKDIQRQIGLLDYMERGGVVVIEWADLISDALPPERLEIIFEHTKDGRILNFVPRGEFYKRLVGELFRKGDEKK